MEPNILVGHLVGQRLLFFWEYWITSLLFLLFVDLLRKKIVIFHEFDFVYDIGQWPMVAILSFPDELFDY